MEMLRWILLFAGVAVVLGVYLYSRFRNRNSDESTLPWKRFDRSQEITYTVDEQDLPLDDADRSPAFEQREFDQFDIEEAGEPALGKAGLHAAADNPPDDGELEALGHRMHMADKASPDKPAARAARQPSSRPSRQQQPSLDTALQEMIIVLYLTSRNARKFRGDEILRAMQALGLEYGEKRVFHYHAPGANKDSVFSIANLLEPGWFDLGTIDSFTTPGLVIFLQLPGPLEELRAFDLMLEKAQQLKELLSGDLKDDARRPLTGQMISHLRDQVQEFTHRRKLTVS